MSSLRFHSGLAVDVLNGTQLFLLSDSRQVLIDSAPAAAVAAAVDGKRTLTEVVGLAARQVGPGPAFAAVNSLLGRRYLRTGDPVPGGWSAYLEGRGLESDSIAEELSTLPFALVPVVLDRPDDEVDAVLDRVSVSLREAGIGARIVADAADLGDAEIPIVVAEDYVHPTLEAINARALALGRRWTLVKPWGQAVWVGPSFVPGISGCWNCLRDRLTANRQSERYLAERLGRWPSVRASGLMPGAVDVASTALVSQATALAAGAPPPLDGCVRSIDLATLDARTHEFLRLPTCPECGDLRTLATDDVVLAPVQATNRHDGGYRVCTPDETITRLEKHISPITGTVSKLESLGVDTDGITFSFAAGHNFAVVSDSLRMLSMNMRGQSGGKGRTRQQARASAVCEAIERYSGVWTPAVPAVRSAYRDLDWRAVHPHDVLLFSDAQYAERDHLEFADSKFHRVPEPFDETRPVDFTPGRSLTTGDEVLIPAGLAWYGVPDLVTGPQYAYTDSNGQAAGNTLEEAILQGMCEVAERDAIGTWWFNRIQRPGVDLDSFDDPYVEVLRQFYAERGRNVWVVDVSNDLGIHVFSAMSQRDHDVQDIMIGFGAHPSPSVALFRALTELNQFLPYVARRDEHGETIYGTDDAATIEWCTNATVESEPWLLPDPALPVRRLADLSGPDTYRLDELVRAQVDRFAAAGVETIVLNQTRPEIELSVVKVVTPGLRHFWKRSAPGRLYETPVRLGWRQEPLTESELNPRSVFF